MRRIALFGMGAAIGVGALAFTFWPDSEPDFIAERAPVRWDEEPLSERWTRASLRALETHGAPLIALVPEDIGDYCPAYGDGGEEVRKAFWLNLLASLSYHESTWRPTVSGGDGKWHGLLQILPATARGYGCRAGDEDSLKDGSLNLSCAIRIMAVTVPRDQVISRGFKGIAADWGPFHQERKRLDMQSYTSALPFCQK